MDVARQPAALTVVLATLFGALFAVRHLMHPWPAEAAAAMPGMMPGDLIAEAAGRYRVTAAIVCTLLVLVNMVSLFRTTVRNQITTDRNYTTPLLYLLAAFSLFIPAAPIVPLLASFLVWRGVIYFIASFRRSAGFGKVFLGAFFIGIAPIVYPQAIVYAILVPVSLRIFRRSGRESVVSLIGLLTPFFISGYLSWAFGGSFTGFFAALSDAVTAPGEGFPVDGPVSSVIAYVFCGLTTFITLLGILSYIFASATMRTRASAIMSLMVFMAIAAAGGMLLPGASWSGLMIAALPVSMLATLFFVRFTGALPLALYILYLASAAALNLYPFLIRLLCF